MVCSSKEKTLCILSHVLLIRIIFCIIILYCKHLLHAPEILFYCCSAQPLHDGSSTHQPTHMLLCATISVKMIEGSTVTVTKKHTWPFQLPHSPSWTGEKPLSWPCWQSRTYPWTISPSPAIIAHHLQTMQHTQFFLCNKNVQQAETSLGQHGL